MRAWRRMVGSYRMWWKWCPCCNSDAPAMHTCPVCQGKGSRWGTAEWWQRFEALDYPMR